MKLEDIRADIDRIDNQLVQLLCERMDCSKRVADYKRENGLPVFDKTREKAILEKISARSGEYAGALQSIYASMMEQSRAIQYPLTDTADVTQFIPAKDPEAVRLVGCQGIEGAYAHLTAKRLYPNAEVKFYDTWADVCRGVENGEIEYGILPVENSWAGSVHDVYDLLIGGDFTIVNCADARIHHNLIGLPGANKTKIKTVLSHPQALAQCAEYIDQMGYEREQINNTARAIKMVADKNDPTLAAIGSAYGAQQYGLDILQSEVASARNNTTRFVSICKQPEKMGDAQKISIVLSVEHRSGGLYQLLASFASCGVNMTKIESRPIKNRTFEYLFYMDLNGNLADKATAGVLSTIKKELPYFKLLGNYPECSIILT